MNKRPPAIILASASSARAARLSGAGVACEVVPARIDEDAVKSAMIAVDSHVHPAAIAARLAQEKARAISRDFHGRLVIGADQVLVFENTIYSKVETMDEARIALDEAVDLLLVEDFPLGDIRYALKLVRARRVCGGKTMVEYSTGATLETLRALAQT